MDWQKVKEINNRLNSVDIKGKQYVEVNERVKAFRELFPEGSIETEIISNDNGVCVIKATAKDKDVVIATGHAYEKEGSTFINKTSYLENAETSAVGRALGFLGIGIETSIASYEEVGNAIANQETEKTITKLEASSMVSLAENAGWVDASNEIMKKYGVQRLGEITKKQYAEFVKEMDSPFKGQSY